MATNWFIGIDEALSTPGGSQVALVDYYFVDAINGDDTTGDGSPDNPWATITNANSVLGIYARATIVVASGLYDYGSGGLALQFKDITANVPHTTIIKSTNIVGNSGCFITGVVLYECQWNPAPNNQGPTCTNCIAIRNSMLSNTTSARVSWVQSVIIDSQLKTDVGYNFNSFYENCTVINSTIQGYSIVRCDLDALSTFELKNDNAANDNVRFQCNFRGTLDDTTYSPNAFTIDSENINVDPEYIGDITNNLEMLINASSPLIGAGDGNSTIGALSIGHLVDLSSPAENNDITVGATIEITSPSSTGNIKPQITTFDQVRTSPIPVFNGLPNNNNNVPDSQNTTLAPKRKTVPILYRETVGGADLTGDFLYNVPMYQDNSGNKTGEDDFDPFDISSDGDILNNPDNLTAANLIQVAEIQENYTLNEQ